MVFVTLGTQDKPFRRLLDAIEKEIKAGRIKDRVVVQAGCTNYKSDVMEIFDLVDMDSFQDMMRECDFLITHGGVGSIISGLNQGKKVIAVARLARFKEHVNDHQLQIVENFNAEGYLIGIKDMNDLGDAIARIKDFKPKKFNSNTANMIDLLENLIKKSQ